MKRLHELQTEMNRVKMDLLARHYLANKWNFEVWFNSVIALYFEGEAKYKAEERIEIMNLETVINFYMKNEPVFV